MRRNLTFVRTVSVLVLVGVHAHIVSPISFAQLNQAFVSPIRSIVSSESPNSYCGLHCVYAASQCLGRRFKFGEIVSTDFLSSAGGSTAADLLSALENVGLNGSVQHFLTLEHLELLNQPVILHTRSPGTATRYSHWMLFLGVDEGRLLIYDPPRDYGELSAAELLSIWDGAGIIVGTKTPEYFAPVSLSMLRHVTIAALLIMLLSLRLSGSTLICSATLFGVIILHGLSHSGFLRAPQAVANVQAAFFTKDIPLVDPNELECLQNGGACYIVDARFKRAYALEHIPGAVNVSVASGYLKMLTCVLKAREMNSVVV